MVERVMTTATSQVGPPFRVRQQLVRVCEKFACLGEVERVMTTATSQVGPHCWSGAGMLFGLPCYGLPPFAWELLSCHMLLPRVIFGLHRRCPTTHPPTAHPSLPPARLASTSTPWPAAPGSARRCSLCPGEPALCML